ncbi:DUF4127 family protein [Oscillibacter sp.]|uniref:DUF4127 family protein n=1 Tax=Oscillibacter sp. TaxID=1945593 RepID=UPI001B3EF39A|nr:DUF4127 family protein [Oscillibacter sp.]MBP3509583.1 DUF4127 family protein [Oscillibacter sp.]
MKKRILAAALACLLLAGCGTRRTEPLAAEEPAAAGVEIAYVPLDDRPDNVERVEYLADSLGYQLVMPEKALYRTALDGQPKNFDSLQRGEPWSLFTWVLEQEAAGCDRYILSLDQLHSGGLVSSRSMTGDEVSLPGGGTTSSSELMDSLLSALAEDENNVVWLLDSVMRLAPTVGYQGGTIEAYNALRAYGAEPRPGLDGSNLTIENIETDYRRGGRGVPLDPAAFGLTEEQVDEYLAARSRKLELSNQLLQTVRGGGYENFRVLIGIDDSSAEECIQKNEIAYLRSCLREGDALLSGVDDLAFKAMTKLYLEESGWEGAGIAVRYYGGTEDQPACIYDFQPLTQIVEAHLDFFGLTETVDAELQMLVLTQPADEDKKADYYNALIKDLNDCRKQNKPVILIDAGNNRYGTAFHDALTKETELGWLLSYAGFLDMAIVTGTALSHGVARYAFLQSGEQTDATERAFVRTVADSVLKDFCYRNVVREDVAVCVRDELGGNANNFWQPQIDIQRVTDLLARRMDEETADAVRNLERSNFISSLEPYAERGWGGIELENYRFPWDRAFEIGMDIRLGDFTEPHEKVLNLYIK